MDDYQEMMKEHDAREDGVYLVEVFDKDVFIQHGIFNNSALAQTWMRSLPNKYTCMCAPFIMNQPDVGSVEKKDMQ